METDKGQALQMSDSRSPTKENKKSPWSRRLLERELVKEASEIQQT